MDMDIAKLLQIEEVASHVKEAVQCDQYNYFVSSRKKLTDHIFMCKTTLERILSDYQGMKNEGEVDTSKLSSLWIHGLGALAIDRATDIVLSLNTQFFPGQLKAFVYTETLDGIDEIIRMTPEGNVVQRNSHFLKPAIRIRLTVYPYPSANTVCDIKNTNSAHPTPVFKLWPPDSRIAHIA